MAYSANTIVNVNVALTGTGPQPAAFTDPVQIFESTVSPSTRLHGPFVSAADVVDFGYTDGSPPHLWAQTLMMQQPRISRFYIGARRVADADDGDAFDAIVSENPGRGYIYNSALRESAEALALAAAVEASTYPKIAIVQSSATLLPSVTWLVTFGGTYGAGDLVIEFDGYGIAGSPIEVLITVGAGPSPATLALAIAALAAELATQTDEGGDIEGVVMPESIVATATTLEFRITPGLASGSVNATNTMAGGTAAEEIVAGDVDGGIGETLFALQYTRTALAHYSDDSVYLDGAWTSRCGSFDLDVRKGIWAHKNLIGIAGDQLSNAEITALRAVNANYFGPAIANSGIETQSFTAQGWTPNGLTNAGRRIDVTISLDWLAARLQEAGLAVLLTATHGVLATPAGINLFTAAFNRVLRIGVAAGHLMDFRVPEGEEYAGTVTPIVNAPDIRTQTAAQRASRSQTWSILCYLAPYVEAVTVNVQVNQ